MSALQQIRQEDQRLIILQTLADESRRTTNEHILNMALANAAHRLTVDAVRAELAWLESVKAIATEDLGGMVIARITRRGQDVVDDLIRIPGITRPRPDL